MDFDKEILMMNEDEARNRAKELLNENQVDLITKYMFLEQKLQKQKEVIDKAIEFIDRWIDKWYANSMLDDKGYLCLLLDILKEGQNELI